jgi:hypothetical protein
LIENYSIYPESKSGFPYSDSSEIDDFVRTMTISGTERFGG